MLNHIKTIKLEDDDQCVFACEENVHVTDDFVVEDEKSTENQEWGILRICKNSNCNIRKNCKWQLFSVIQQIECFETCSIMLINIAHTSILQQTSLTLIIPLTILSFGVSFTSVVNLVRLALVAVSTKVNWSSDHDQIERIRRHRMR